MKLTGLFEAIPLSMSQSRLDAYIFADLKLGYIKCAFFAPGSDLWKQLETPTEVMLLGLTNQDGTQKAKVTPQRKSKSGGALSMHRRKRI